MNDELEGEHEKQSSGSDAAGLDSLLQQIYSQVEIPTSESEKSGWINLQDKPCDLSSQY